MKKTKDILWGGATASSQYEGGYKEGGKGLDTQDCRPYLKRTSDATTSTRLLTQDIIDEAKKCEGIGHYPFRQGSDGYHHIDEDIALLKELGIDIYRFSISWARLYPHGDEETPNEEGIKFYDHIFKEVHKAGMKIFLTMNHYAVPLYLVEHYGGWTNRKLIEFYERFATVVFENWGEYIDPEIIDLFEEETGIDVIYEEFETNEIMYPKIQSGAIAYDVVCPSDYMIQRMIENDLLAEINYDHIPNLKYIGDNYMKMSRQFDPENKYSVPYLWGTVGILYNKKMVDEPVDSWGILWDKKYEDSILMQDSVRDAFAVALKYLGYSLNSTDLDELEAAKNLLIEQKPLVQAYVIDQVRDKMIGGEAALGVIYSGEALYCQQENPDLDYVIPKEGTNIWIDSWVIPKNAKNVENAEAFINFLCRPDIAKMNFDYITYSIPNTAGRDLIEDESLRNSPIAFPDDSKLENCETFRFLGDDNDALYNRLWREIKSK